MAVSKVIGRALSAAPYPGFIFGLTMSTAGASATMTIAAGFATDSTYARLMNLSSSIAKTTSAWAVGTAAGGLDTGAIANSTWYHFYLMERPDTGVVDVVFSVNANLTTAVGVIPGAYTLFRRIGSMKTNGSAQWTKFIQNGDNFMWDIAANDVTATNPGTSAVTRTITTPLGIITEAILAIYADANTAADAPAAVYISDLAITDSVPSGSTGFTLYNFFTVASRFIVGGTGRVNTNTSSQVRSRLGISSTNTVLQIATLGFNDARGRLA